MVICFVAVIALVGAFTFRNYQNKMKQQLAKAEQENRRNDKRKNGSDNDK